MALYDITAEANFVEFDTAYGVQPSNVVELDSTHYMVATNGEALDGYIDILELDVNVFKPPDRGVTVTSNDF